MGARRRRLAQLSAQQPESTNHGGSLVTGAIYDPLNDQILATTVQGERPIQVASTACLAHQPRPRRRWAHRHLGKLPFFDDVEEKIFAFGDFGLYENDGDLGWTPRPLADGSEAAPVGLYSCAYVPEHESLFVIGGVKGMVPASSELLRLQRDEMGAFAFSFESVVGAVPSDRGWPSITYAKAQDALLLVGGTDFTTPFADAHRYDLSTSTWSEIGDVSCVAPAGRAKGVVLHLP